jgi:hypothetical protein
MSIIDRARKLVCDMNEFEAHRSNMPVLSVQDWPTWAQRDFRLACDAMVEVRAEALKQRRAKKAKVHSVEFENAELGEEG